MALDEIRKALRDGRFLYGQHTASRLIRYGLTLRELVNSVCEGEAEIIEDYPGDPRGHSCLILAVSESQVLHLVCTVGFPLFSITIYIPDPEQWAADFRERR